MTERAPALTHLPAVERALAGWLRGTHHGATSPSSSTGTWTSSPSGSTAAARPTAACSSTASTEEAVVTPAPAVPRGRRHRRPAAASGPLLSLRSTEWSEADTPSAAKINLTTRGKRGEHTFDSNICSTRMCQRSREGEAVDGTAVRNRVGLTDGAATASRRPLHLRSTGPGALHPALPPGGGVHPARHRRGGQPGCARRRLRLEPWDYQREQVDVQGRGALNAYGRTAIRATAWLAKSSIERQRDMLETGLFDVTVGAGAADSIGGWRSRYARCWRRPPMPCWPAIAWGVVRRPAWRHLWRRCCCWSRPPS